MKSAQGRSSAPKAGPRLQSGQSNGCGCVLARGPYRAPKGALTLRGRGAKCRGTSAQGRLPGPKAEPNLWPGEINGTGVFAERPSGRRGLAAPPRRCPAVACHRRISTVSAKEPPPTKANYTVKSRTLGTTHSLPDVPSRENCIVGSGACAPSAALRLAHPIPSSPQRSKPRVSVQPQRLPPCWAEIRCGPCAAQ